MKRLLILSTALLTVAQAGATCLRMSEKPLNNETKFYLSELPTTHTAPVWQADKVYLQGDTVEYDGEIFEARWWSKNELPSIDWNSWIRATNIIPLWQQDSTYEYGKTVLYDNYIWKAQYWSTADLPSSASAWQLDVIAESLRTMKLTTQQFRCDSLEEYRVEHAPAEWNGPAYVINTQNTYGLAFGTIEADELPAHRWTTYINGNVIASGELAAEIDGHSCQNNASCDALLVGQKAQIRFHAIDYVTQYRTYYENVPYPMPTLPPEPLDGFVEICHEDNYCLRYPFDHN